MIKYLKLPFLFNKEQMQQELQQVLSEKWSLHYNTQQYKGNWEALALRSIGGSTENIIALDGSNLFEDTYLMGLTPYIKQVVDSIHCPKMSIRLLNLKAGAIIHAHSDLDLYFEEGEVRLHVPIVTHPLVEFYLDGERMMMDEGECWYMNLALKHRLHNKSTIDRVHLVMDCQVNDWLVEQFNSKLITLREDVPDTLKKGEDVHTKKQVIEQLRQLNTATSNKMADEMETALQ
jgi:hypothetical protein